LLLVVVIFLHCVNAVAMSWLVELSRTRW